MTKEQLLLEKWRNLPPSKQQEVIDFLEFLESRIQNKEPVKSTVESQSQLGEKLQEIRAEIVASGIPLLSAEEVEQEKASRRGGYRGDDR